MDIHSYFTMFCFIICCLVGKQDVKGSVIFILNQNPTILTENSRPLLVRRIGFSGCVLQLRTVITSSSFLHELFIYQKKKKKKTLNELSVSKEKSRCQLW